MALGWPRSHADRVRRVLEDAGVPLRDRSAAAYARHGLDLQSISSERWEELYWAPESRYPSVALLAKRLSEWSGAPVAENTVRRYLQRAGVTVRTQGEQEHIDIALGRRGVPRGGRPLTAADRAKALQALGKRGKQWRENVRAGARERAKDARGTAPCAWCAAPREYTRSRLRELSAPVCNRSCAQRLRAWRKKLPDAPRPLIIAALQERVRHSGRALTLATAERFAPDVGATPAEVWAALA